MTEQLFSAASEVDRAFLFILAFAVGALVLVTALMLYFSWRYHHTRNPEAVEIPGSLGLELLWTILPTAIVMAMFWFGWTSFKAMRTVPEGAMEVGVEARMWSWAFTYPGGRRSAELVVPVGGDVKLAMTSRDVIHSFYVPALRLKMDTVPGLTTTAWFNIAAPGEFDILCAEYCGLKHANMITTLRAVPEEDFRQWLAGADAASARAGELFSAYGCTACHDLGGGQGLGPPLDALGGRTGDVLLPDGGRRRITVDADYLRRAMLDPGAEIAEGYEAMMPSYQDQIPEADLEAMIRWMLTGDTAGPPPGRELAEAEGCMSCHSTDGSSIAGPSFRDLAGSVRRVRDQSGAVHEVVADDAYLGQSILDPGALVVEGETPIMPEYDYLDAEQVARLVEYIRSLGPGGGAQP
ncbi:cytochrome c oxidase subunit II [Desulfocurvus sp.]|jgi:cytochrome c oxidase subunit 2|uniref:cytochrome c oxidase subunit II n=1 Tax=Desulfocurvus sp. TaxID=2871698 RepID=UPI0025BA6C94|nr:cytochrome c oxidase subunit II [Desulfocurvus sp.]MCK9240478.1 cytochrome c oxidase subunit II [Desulfocurvus sp.]